MKQTKFSQYFTPLCCCRWRLQAIISIRWMEWTIYITRDTDGGSYFSQHLGVEFSAHIHYLHNSSGGILKNKAANDISEWTPKTEYTNFIKFPPKDNKTRARHYNCLILKWSAFEDQNKKIWFLYRYYKDVDQTLKKCLKVTKFVVQLWDIHLSDHILLGISYCRSLSHWCFERKYASLSFEFKAV